jgi:hypothetical protein
MELLAPQPDGAEQLDHRVEGVPAPPRIGRGVGLQAVEDDLDVLRRERDRGDVVPIARMEQEGRVESVEQAVLDHDRLAAATFLGRRAQEHDLARELAGDRGQPDRRPDTGRGHRVVAAAVAQTGQRVVLGEDADPWRRPAPATAPDRPDRGRQRSGRVLDLVAVAAEGLGDPARGLDLPERRLGRRVDPVAEVEDLVTGRLDRGGDPPLCVAVRLGRIEGIQVGGGGRAVPGAGG